MTRDELRLEFANTNVPNIEAVDWVKGDGFGGVRGTYRDEYMGFLEDIILKTFRIVYGECDMERNS